MLFCWRGDRGVRHIDVGVDGRSRSTVSSGRGRELETLGRGGITESRGGYFGSKRGRRGETLRAVGRLIGVTNKGWMDSDSRDSRHCVAGDHIRG